MAAVSLHDKDTSLQNDDVLVSKSYSRSGSWPGSVGLSPGGSSWSGLSSPFGSELGSTETESEEEQEDDEFMAELTKQMADYMLEDDDDDASKAMFRVSRECKVTPITQHDSQPFVVEQEQEVHSYKVDNQVSLLETQVNERKQGASKAPEPTQQPERKNLDKVQNRAAGVLGAAPTGWSPLQQPQQMNYGSGMRAVFLGGPAPKTKTSGTGVFLPRGAASNPPEVRKKLGCSTVLIPARVLHTLQLHFEKVKNQSPQSNGSAGLKSYQPQYDLKLSQAKQHSQSQSHSANKTHEICLPQEWTY